VPDDVFHDRGLLAQRRGCVVVEARRIAGMVTAGTISGAMVRFIDDRELAYVTAEDDYTLPRTSPVG